MRRAERRFALRAMPALLGLLGLLGLLLSGCGAGVSASDRADYGHGGWALWSPLSDFERAALKRRGAAATGDYDALLTLALVGSGEPRDEDTLQALRERAWAFVRRHRAGLLGLADHAARGKRLLKLMHTELLGTDGGRQLAKYRPGQSTLAGALDDGRYNCVSSALLYIVLARAVGLVVHGVHMPHHAFVELVLPDGRRVDVETTASSGFAVRRDRAWFAGKGGTWARDRGLAMSSWAHYQRRRIVSPLQLVADNMINQHSSADRIGRPASERLREVRGVLLPRDARAQLGRLNVYGREHNALHAAGEYATIVRMFTAVEPALADIQARFSGAIRNTVAWHRGHFAGALLRGGDYKLAVGWMKVALQLASGTPDRGKVEHNVIGAVWRQAEALAKGGDFPAGQATLRPWHALCARYRFCLVNRYWLYAEWASEAFGRKDWRAAIQRSGVALPYAPDAGRRANARSNLEAAWLNLIVQVANRGDRAGARNLATQCANRHPWAARCRSMRGRL